MASAQSVRAHVGIYIFYDAHSRSNYRLFFLERPFLPSVGCCCIEKHET